MATNPKKKQTMSKAELKRALVTKRLAMLEDDADDHEETGESPSNNKSRKQSVIISEDEHEEVEKLELSVQPRKKISCKRPLVISDDEHEEVGKLELPVQPTKKKSRKQSVVVSDDEPEEVGKLELLVQPSKKESHKRPVVRNDEQEEVGKLELLVRPTKKQSRKRSVVVSDDELEEVRKLALLTPSKKESRKQSVVISDDEPEEVGKLALLVQPSKKESRKRSVVISDDEPEEVGKLELLVQPSKKARTKRKRVTSTDYLSNEIHNSLDSPRNKRTEIAEPIDDSPSSAMKRAEEVRTNLPTEYPSFAKMMLPSHVSRVFWLHLPSKFSKEHLPKCDSIIEIIDEDGMKFKCNYLVHKSGLSGGWRGFSLDHGLSEGDVVIFQLIAVTTFKVYIVRNDGQDEFQGTLGLLTLDDCRGHEVSEKRDDRAQMDFDYENNSPRNSESRSTSCDNIECEVLDGICFSDSAINFEAIKSFENFRIIVDGLVVDSKFSDANRKKYYELCCSQKSFLHEQLLKGLNCNLVIGIIMETINIADAIRACTSSMSIADLEIWEQTLKIWEQTLKGFELLGMKVNFLRAKLNLMLGNMDDSSNGLQKCIDEQACAAKKMKGLESKLTKLKSMMEKINLEIEAEVAATAQKLQSKLKKIANSPW